MRAAVRDGIVTMMLRRLFAYIAERGRRAMKNFLTYLHLESAVELIDFAIDLSR